MTKTHLSTDSTHSAPEWLKIDEAAKLVGLGRRTIERYVQSGEIPHGRVGRGPKARIRIEQRELEAWLRRNAEAVSE
jgi:excisionase family DNA binding protein